MIWFEGGQNEAPLLSKIGNWVTAPELPAARNGESQLALPETEVVVGEVYLTHGSYMKSLPFIGRLSSATVPGLQMVTALIATYIYWRDKVAALMLSVAVVLSVGVGTLAVTAQSALANDTLKTEKHCRGKVMPNIYFCLFDEKDARHLTKSTLHFDKLQKWQNRKLRHLLITDRGSNFEVFFKNLLATKFPGLSKNSPISSPITALIFAVDNPGQAAKTDRYRKLIKELTPNPKIEAQIHENLRKGRCAKISVDDDASDSFYSFFGVIKLSSMTQNGIEKCFIYIRLSMLGLTVDREFVWNAFDEQGHDWVQINKIIKRMSEN